MYLVHTVTSVSEFFRRTASAFCTIAMFVIVCDVLFGIVARAVLKQPPVWTEELARYLFVWVTFLGATAIYPTGENIVVDLILRLVSPRLGRHLTVFAHLIVGVTALFMITQGLAIADRTMAQRSSVMQVPFGLIYSVIPLSGFILGIHTLSGSLQSVFRPASGQATDQIGGW